MSIRGRLGLAAVLGASVCLSAGCKHPEVGFRFKATDNSMESFLPGSWRTKSGERYELTGDELFTREFETVLDPKKPKRTKVTIHAAGKYAVDGDRITLTYVSLAPRTGWAESGDLEEQPAKLREAAAKLVPLDVPHVGKMSWQDMDHVTIHLQADLSGPAETIELKRDMRTL